MTAYREFPAKRMFWVFVLYVTLLCAYIYIYIYIHISYTHTYTYIQIHTYILGHGHGHGVFILATYPKGK